MPKSKIFRTRFHIHNNQFLIKGCISLLFRIIIQFR